MNGNWTGVLSPGPVTLHFNVHLQSDGGTWDSVDQHAVIPIKGVTVTGNTVKVDLGIARFEGTLSQSGEKIEGTFKQNGIELPMVLGRFAGDFAKLRRPQEPVPPYPYTEGGTEADIARQVQQKGELFEIYRQPVSAEEKRKRVHVRFGEGKGVEGQIRMMESPTFRDLQAFDPGPIFKRISRPVLALDGKLDTQVSAKLKLPAIAAMLAGSDSKDWQVAELPGLNPSLYEP